MLNSNNISNVSVLDKYQKTLDVVADKTTFMSNKFRKWLEKILNGAENIKIKIKRNFKYLQEIIPICPICGSKNVVENGGRPRKIIFSTGEEYFKIQGYLCKDKHNNAESQFFEANIENIVSDNSNYSQEFIDVAKYHNAPVHAPLRVTADFLNKLGFLSVSHQTIQNIIFSVENPSKIPSYLSGKFSFDVLWCKAHGKWKSFYFCITDVMTKKVVYDGMYETESTDNLDEFFKEIFKHLPEEKYITVDLDPKYKAILKKYGFTRQLCLKHTPKAIKNNLNNIISAYKKKRGKISLEDKKVIEEQKQNIIEMILNKDLKEVNRKFKEIMDNFESLHPCIQQLMNKMIIPNFDDFFWYLKVDGVEMTSNVSELNFQKSLSKHVKRRMHTIEGSEQRIYLKNEYRNKKSDEKYENKIFKDLMTMVTNNDHI
jgi:hypothetical protein